MSPTEGLHFERQRWWLLVEVLRPYRRRTAMAAIMVLLSTLVLLIPPYLSGRVIDDVIRTKSDEQLIVISIVLLVALAAGWATSVIGTWLVGDVGQHILFGLRMRVVQHLHDLPATYHGTVGGGLVSRVTNDVQRIDKVIFGVLTKLMSGLIIVLGTLVVLFVIDWQMALVVLFVFPSLVVLSALFQRVSAPLWRRAIRSLGATSEYIAEGAAGAVVVRTFAQWDRHLARFDELNDATEEAQLRPLVATRIFVPLAELVGVLGIAVILLYGGHRAITGAIELGTVVAFVAYLRQALGPLPQLAGLFGSVQQAGAALDELGTVLRLPTDPRWASGRPPAPALLGDIVAEGIWFAYEGQSWVLRDLTFHAAPGETLALVGPSGSGKTTIVKVLNGTYPPSRGRVLYDGWDLAEHDLRSFSHQSAIVTQEPFLFAGTVAGNIAWASPGCDPQDVIDAARRVDALDILERLPQGLDTHVGERGDQLSNGQRQLVALARAMIVDPRVLFLDEATSSLDAAVEERVQHSLMRLREGRTTVVVAHRLSTVRTADRILYIDQGRLVESGSPSELRASGGAFAQMESMFDAYRDQ